MLPINAKDISTSPAVLRFLDKIIMTFLCLHLVFVKLNTTQHNVPSQDSILDHSIHPTISLISLNTFLFLKNILRSTQ